MQGLIESLEPRRLLSAATTITPFILVDPDTKQMIAQPRMDASDLVQAGWKLLEHESGYRWWVRGYPPDAVMIERGYEKITWDGQVQWARRGAWEITFRFDAGGPFPPDDVDLQPGDVWLPPVPPNYHEMIAGLGLALEIQTPYTFDDEPRFGQRTISVRVMLGEGMTGDQLQQAVSGLPDVVRVGRDPGYGYVFLADVIEDSRVHHDVEVIPYDRRFAGSIPVQMWDPLNGADAVEAVEPVETVSTPVPLPVFSHRAIGLDQPTADLFEAGDDPFGETHPPLQSL